MVGRINITRHPYYIARIKLQAVLMGLIYCVRRMEDSRSTE